MCWGNIYGANPNSAQAKRALGNIDTIIYLATKPNIGHFHGLAKTNTIILPVLNRFVTTPHFKTPSGKAKILLSTGFINVAQIIGGLTTWRELAGTTEAHRSISIC